MFFLWKKCGSVSWPPGSAMRITASLAGDLDAGRGTLFILTFWMTVYAVDSEAKNPCRHGN